jgi:hypothetical protein
MKRAPTMQLALNQKLKPKKSSELLMARDRDADNSAFEKATPLHHLHLVGFF